MKFLFIIAHDDNFRPNDELTQKIVSWNRQMKEKGYLIDSNPLVPADEGITIRIRNRYVEKEQGPFSDSREQMCAYALLECDSIEQAEDLAEEHPMASAATLEIRKIWEDLRPM